MKKIYREDMRAWATQRMITLNEGETSDDIAASYSIKEEFMEWIPSHPEQFNWENDMPGFIEVQDNEIHYTPKEIYDYEKSRKSFAAALLVEGEFK